MPDSNKEQNCIVEEILGENNWQNLQLFRICSRLEALIYKHDSDMKISEMPH